MSPNAKHVSLLLSKKEENIYCHYQPYFTFISEELPCEGMCGAVYQNDQFHKGFILYDCLIHLLLPYGIYLVLLWYEIKM